MSNRDPLAAEVLITAEVSAEEEQAIVDAFRTLDVAARTRMVPTRRGPAEMVARRYHQGLAPFILLTGGVNRHIGVLEAIEHRRILLEHGVPEAVMRYEDSSTTTPGNVERVLPFLPEALRSVPGVDRSLQVVPPPSDSAPPRTPARGAVLPRRHLGTDLRRRYGD